MNACCGAEWGGFSAPIVVARGGGYGGCGSRSRGGEVCRFMPARPSCRLVPESEIGCSHRSCFAVESDTCRRNDQTCLIQTAAPLRPTTLYTVKLSSKMDTCTRCKLGGNAIFWHWHYSAPKYSIVGMRSSPMFDPNKIPKKLASPEERSLYVCGLALLEVQPPNCCLLIRW